MASNPETSNNPHAVRSLILAVIAVLSACVGAAPIPFTGWVCFPASFVCGLLALIYGVVAMRQIRAQNAAGGTMAWAGILVGSLTLLCVLCLAALLGALFYFAPDYIPSLPQLN